MTPQEALNLLNNVEFAEKYQGKDLYTDMLLMCKSALEKQIPKKPKIYNNVYPKDLYECPDCQCGLRSNATWKDTYCCNCGLKIDWSDTE